MNLTAEQLQENFDKLIALIDAHITGERKDQLIKLYSDHAERIMMMPASSTDHHHNAFPGGYVDHVLRVVDCALSLVKVWQAQGADINYTTEELVFAAINHDLGKIGDENSEQYLPNDSEWHRKNMGKMYKVNPEPAFMLVPDRGLFLLQQRGIKVSLNEWFGIRLHDGVYDEANRAYYFSNSKDSKLRTNLPILLHHADHMASRIEFEKWNKQETKQPVKQSKKSTTEPTQEQKEDLMDVFNGLFK